MNNEDKFHYHSLKESGFSDLALMQLRNALARGYNIRELGEQSCIVGRYLKPWDPVTRKPQKLEFISISSSGRTKKSIAGILQNGHMMK